MPAPASSRPRPTARSRGPPYSPRDVPSNPGRTAPLVAAGDRRRCSSSAAGPGSGSPARRRGRREPPRRRAWPPRTTATASRRDPAPAPSASAVALRRPSPAAAPTPTPAPGQTGRRRSALTLAARLQKSLDRFAAAHRLPGSSVTITWPDGRTWTGTTGHADVKAGRPGHRRHAFAIASMSKTFTSALILGLVDDGKLSLDTKVAALLPAVRLGTPGGRSRPRHGPDAARPHERAGRLLLRQGHRQGPDGRPVARPGPPTGPWPTSGKPLGKPGRSWHYSNTNYLLLGLLAEKVGGTPFADPRPRPPARSAQAPGRLRPGRREAARPARARLLLQQPEPGRRPRSGLADARRDGRAVHLGHHRGGSGGRCRGDLGRPGRPGRAPCTAAPCSRPRRSPSAVGDAKKTAPYRPYVPYGLGVQVTEDRRSHRAYGHSGRFIGVRGELRYLPGPRLAIAVLTNQNGVDLRPLTAKLVSLALPKPPCIAGAEPVADARSRPGPRRARASASGELPGAPWSGSGSACGGRDGRARRCRIHRRGRTRGSAGTGPSGPARSPRRRGTGSPS